MRLALAAWIAFATHVLAALASLLLLQPGTPVEPDAAARAAYVAANLAAWRLGWASWTLASLSLVALLAALHRPAAWLAALGLFFDLPAQLALAAPALAWERALYVSTGVVANGLYTAALAWAAWRAPLPRALRWGAAPAVAAGVAVSAASAALHPGALFVSAGVLTAAMLAWTLALALWAGRRARA